MSTSLQKTFVTRRNLLSVRSHLLVLPELDERLSKARDERRHSRQSIELGKIIIFFRPLSAQLTNLNRLRFGVGEALIVDYSEKWAAILVDVLYRFDMMFPHDFLGLFFFVRQHVWIIASQARSDNA